MESHTQISLINQHLGLVNIGYLDLNRRESIEEVSQLTKLSIFKGAIPQIIL